MERQKTYWLFLAPVAAGVLSIRLCVRAHFMAFSLAETAARPIAPGFLAFWGMFLSVGLWCGLILLSCVFFSMGRNREAVSLKGAGIFCGAAAAGLALFTAACLAPTGRPTWSRRRAGRFSPLCKGKRRKGLDFRFSG